MSTEHFEDREFYCKCFRSQCAGKRAPHPDLLLRLERIRQLYRKPIVVLSGVRCVEQNAAVGGTCDSEHLVGKAADVACADSAARMALVKFALLADVRRVGIGRTFLHLGVSSSHDQDVCWLY